MLHELPPEIWADQLEEQGIDTSLLRAWLCAPVLYGEHGVGHLIEYGRGLAFWDDGDGATQTFGTSSTSDEYGISDVWGTDEYFRPTGNSNVE